MPDEVLCTIDGGVATVTLNRPGQRNAMNAALLASLSDHFEALDANREVRVVVIRGAGPAFCSGMDLKEMEARGGAQSADPENGVIEVLARVERARHFYEARGFEAIAFGNGSHNEERCPDVLYEWRPRPLV